MGAPFINKSRLLLWGGIALVGALGIAAPKLFQEPAWTKEDAHALMTYATAIGRAEGCGYRDWETDRKSTRLNSSHSGESRMPSSA